MKKGLLILVSLLSSSCSVFGVRTAEELDYTVIEKINDVEIRKYNPYISAQATMRGDYDEIDGQLFGELAGYIFGKNKQKEKIAMTAPVVMNKPDSNKSEKIAMTAPVVLESNDNNEWTMSFSMPKKYTLETLPQPLSNNVQIIQNDETLYAVVRYTGSFDSLESRKANKKKLLEWLNTQQKYQMISPPVFAGYDPPFTLPFLRRNEVLVKIKSNN